MRQFTCESCGKTHAILYGDKVLCTCRNREKPDCTPTGRDPVEVRRWYLKEQLSALYGAYQREAEPYLRELASLAPPPVVYLDLAKTEERVHAMLQEKGDLPDV